MEADSTYYCLNKKAWTASLYCLREPFVNTEQLQNFRDVSGTQIYDNNLK